MVSFSGRGFVPLRQFSNNLCKLFCERKLWCTYSTSRESDELLLVGLFVSRTSQLYCFQPEHGLVWMNNYVTIRGRLLTLAAVMSIVQKLLMQTPILSIFLHHWWCWIDILFRKCSFIRRIYPRYPTLMIAITNRHCLCSHIFAL